MELQTIRAGQFAKWKGQWYRVLWAGRTRRGDEMAKLHTLPETWPDKVQWVAIADIEQVRKTKPRPADPFPKRTHLDDELDRRLSREE